MLKRTLKVMALVAALTFVLAACGTDSESAAQGELATLETSSTSDISKEAVEVVEDDAETTVLAFAECLRDEGVNVGDPTLNADGSVDMQSMRSADFDPGDPGVQEALDTCGPMLDDIALTGQDVDQTELEDNLLAVAECLRDAGYDVDDPNLDGPITGGPGAIFGDSFDVSDPENQVALDSCLDETGFTRGGDGR